MRISPIATFLLAAMSSLLGAISSAEAQGQSLKPFVTANPPSAHDALRLMFHNQSLDLTANPSCQKLFDAPTGQYTLGGWMAWVLANLEPVDGVSGVDAGCTGPSDRLHCDVMIRRRAGEEIWSWGISFDASSISGAIDPSSLRCHAAG